MAESLSKGLERILNDVQGDSLDSNNFEEIVKMLDYDNNAKPQSIQKLLEICIQDPKDDLKYATETLNIVSVILRKVTVDEFTSKLDLLPSMLKILHIINTSIYSCTSDKIKVLYFKILISYPDEVYAKLENGNEVLELFNLYVHQQIPIELRVQPINVLHKYLKVLPSDKRLKFVKEGFNVWLLKLIPNVMLFANTPDFQFETSLASLEMIVDEFRYIDYYNNPNWQCILQCFCESQKYPTIMKNLLAQGSDVWHRLWIVFIKMLKNHLTKSGSSGSPINSMLPVVEIAFKLGVNSRCHAFQCWSVLIDNFATETNEAYINKRVKLLLIPLYSNNAKVEETVIAKINTWWHLICSCYSKLNNFAEIILLPFLQFCFGKLNVASKSVQVPGTLTDKTKEYCVEALVNIFGHHNCNGCVALPVLKEKILNEKCLLTHRKDLIYCLSEAIKIVAKSASKLRKPYKCAWMTLIKLICDISEDNARKDLFNKLLIMLENLIQDINDETLADIVLNDLILPLFKKDDQITQFLIHTNEQDSWIHKVLSIILNPLLDCIYNKNEMNKAVENVKSFADFIVEHCFHVSIIEALLKQLLPNYKSLVLWTAMTSSVCEKKCDTSPVILHKILLWPLKYLDLLTKVKFSTSLWLALFEFIQVNLGTGSINHEIFDVFNDFENINETNSLFFLNVAIMLLSQKMSAENETEYEREVQLVFDISNKIHGLNHTHPTFLKVINILLELLKKLSKDIDLNIARLVLMIFKLMFTLFLSDCKKSTEVDAVVLVKIQQVLKYVENLLKLETYASLKQIDLTEFLESAHCFGQQQSLKVTTLAPSQMFLKNQDNNNQPVHTTRNVTTSLKEYSNTTTPIDKSNFTTHATNKAKKKETSIVNTVVEDGEEFVVVKSNWKFNPKKLTDNQKEKLKRKREDIPALYQDLSQSQDEFKLSAWKTDSQDTTNTTTTSSKSNDLTTSEKVSSILKNMPNTDVVPKILKNILTENDDTNNSRLESRNENSNEIQTPINKEVKPRVSFKDRVFRNVKILIEKSDVHNDEKHVKSVVDDITPRLQTPTGMKIKIPDTNSASELGTDRPMRVKRKPKKFEEMQIFAIKKRRHSLCTNESENKDSFEDLNHSQDVTEYSDVGVKKLNSSEIVSIDQKDQHILDPNLAEDVLKHSDTQSTNIFNIDHEKLVQDENVDNQQQNSKINVITAVSRIETGNNVVIDNSSVVTDKNQINDGQLDMSENSSVKTTSTKKTGKKKSRIEKELAIDMVEGHPFLKVQSEKRLTRKKASESPVTSRRKNLTQKLNKSKIDQKHSPKEIKEIDKVLDKSRELDTCSDFQKSSFQDENGSQDVIESSQDSTVSIMSAKSSKSVKRVPTVLLENIEQRNEGVLPDNTHQSNKCLNTDSKTVNDSEISNYKSNDDSEFPLNKTAIEYAQIDLTESLDPESVGIITSNEVIVINDDANPPIAVNLDGTYIDLDTQDIAEADTQLMDLNNITTLTETNTPVDETKSLDANEFQESAIDSVNNIDTSTIRTQEDSTRSLTESLLRATETKLDEYSSKLSPRDEEKRKQDFLNNTLEISPIKTLSPVRENTSPSPETSRDYVVIKLSSPVQSNGEPFEKCDSPEIFTEEKMSPDKRDQSPPREENRVITASPRSLSLKKNKPPVRSGGRAAQMLGLCISNPDRLQTILNSEKSVDSEEAKKSSPLNSSARRNLRILYNSTNENNETSEENEEGKNFLKMKRSLPAADSSPSVPILKRKLVDIVDDTTISPANKRKRVSFHDPPVSTTVCVKKYIESSSVRSPQNSATKLQERQSRSQVSVNLKSQKRLDTVFKLDTALTKAVESFSETEVTPNATEDTEMSSLEPTPLVEVVKNSELNNVDPICLELINCMVPIDNIASDLSSSAMRPLLVKEFAGRIETVGDLAKMSELEVNRLCIKAPKVQVAKKVLIEYAKKINTIATEMTPMTEAAFSESTVIESKAVDVEMQTDYVSVGSIEVQTEALPTSLASTQTNTVSTVNCDIQTDESGSKSTADIAMSLLEKSDFCKHLNGLLDVPSKQSIATSLPQSVLIDTFLQEIGLETTNEIIDRLLEKQTSDSLNEQNGRNDNPRLSCIRNYLSKRFSSKDLILLCSDLLKKAYDNI